MAFFRWLVCRATSTITLVKVEYLVCDASQAIVANFYIILFEYLMLFNADRSLSFTIGKKIQVILNITHMQ